jgi:hypothetical protein
MRGELKRWFRTYVRAGARYAPDVQPERPDTLVPANRLDSGELPVIVTASTRYAPLGAANYVGAALANQPAVFLIWLTWSQRERRRQLWLTTAIAVYRRRRPRHRIVVLCSEPEEQAALAADGIQAVFCNHNAFAEERIFRPLPQAGAKLDAIYNAGLFAWKRRELARLVPSCAHIFYQSPGSTHAKAIAYLDQLRALMPHHQFVNTVADGRVNRLDRAEVNVVLSQCRSGLCLSAVEGAMFASIEYLLAGLPVVSTPAVGGRHIFADHEFWLTVPATAEAVRDGVAEIVARNVPRERVRTRTLERIYEHRARLRAAVAAATDGRVMLPDDYGDIAYQRNRDWLAGAALYERLGLRPPSG